LVHAVFVPSQRDAGILGKLWISNLIIRRIEARGAAGAFIMPERNTAFIQAAIIGDKSCRPSPAGKTFAKSIHAVMAPIARFVPH
jgi:hypothetical protein